MTFGARLVAWRGGPVRLRLDHLTRPHIAARDEGAVRTVDLTTNTVVRTATVAGGQIQNVAVSLDGGSLYGTDIGRSELITWDLTSAGSGYVETDVGTPGFRNVFDVAVTPDNAQLYVSTLSDGRVYIFDRATRVLTGSVVTGGSGRYIGFNGLGSHAVVANESGWVNFIH